MLKETLSKFFKVDSLIENLTGFVEARVELLKVEVKEDVSKGLAKGAAWLLIGLVFLFFLALVSIGLALLIGEYLGVVAGFMIISALYLVGASVLYLSRDRIISKLEKTFADMFRKKE